MVKDDGADYFADLVSSNGIPKALFWVISNIVSPVVPYVIVFSIDDCDHFLTHFVDRLEGIGKHRPLIQVVLPSNQFCTLSVFPTDLVGKLNHSSSPLDILQHLCF